MSLPQSLRLTRRRDYEAVRLHGTSAGGKLLGMGVLRSLDDPTNAQPLSGPNAPRKPKLGVIVPKALGHAVVRNKIKRRLRAILREAAGQVPPWRIVTIARRGAVQADFASLRREWYRLAKRLELLPSAKARREDSPHASGSCMS